MSRPGAHNTHARVPADPRLVELDLRSWAGPRVADEGRREALRGRVEMLRLASDGRSLEARVRGVRAQPYDVRVRTAERGLVCRCTCGAAATPACKHVVAALETLRFPLSDVHADPSTRRRSVGRRARGRGRIVQPASGLPGQLVLGGPQRTLTRDERIGLARDEERAHRRQRASRERAAVEPLDDDSPVPRFHVADRETGEPATVTLRGERHDLATCDCADFAGSELQTCKHTERARRSYARAHKRPTGDVLSFWWSPREWTDHAPDPLGELRVDLPVGELPRSLVRFFDVDGWLRDAPPGAERPAWARQAIGAARRVARRHGWVWDLDEQARNRIEAVATRESTRRRLSEISAGPAWREIVSRVGFRLHPYQERGALFLARAGRAFLADDMGLGKTVQAIVAALLLRREMGARRALIVCPASLKHQWRREIEIVCGEQSSVVDGPPATRFAAYGKWRSGFLILNYELVLRDFEAIRASGADLIVLDEAQRIKNWGTKTARAVKALESPHAFILTGTPLENRLLELHSLVEFLYPRALGPRWRLFPYHAVIETDGRVIAYEGLDVLRRRLRPFFLRRDRAEVLDQLPGRTDNTFWTGMTRAQRRPYARQAARVATLLSRGTRLVAAEVRQLLQALTSMRILCNGLAQFDWDDHAERVRDPSPISRSELRALGSPKLEEFGRVLEDLLDESETKIVVFSQWERMLRLAHLVVRDVLARRELRADLFHGGLSSRARSVMLEAFRVDPELRVLFSTDAGGVGLNLQESASIVVNLEVPWNPAVLEQRIGRVHRIGQRESVQVLHFVTRGAIEERVRRVVEDKRALFDGLLVERTDRVTFDADSRVSLVRRVMNLVGDSDDTRSTPSR